MSLVLLFTIIALEGIWLTLGLLRLTRLLREASVHVSQTMTLLMPPPMILAGEMHGDNDRLGCIECLRCLEGWAAQRGGAK